MVLTQAYPVPPDAGTPRAHHLLRRLCQRTEAHCIAALREDRAEFDDFVERSGLASGFASMDVRQQHSADRPGARIFSLLTRRPPFDARIKDPGLLRERRRVIREAALRHAPAVFYCYGIDSLQFVPEDLWRSCVVDCTDPQSLLLERRLRSESLSPQRRLELSLALPLLRRYEARMFRETGAVVYNSSDDIAKLLEIHPDAPLVRVIDGCDTDYFHPGAVSETEEDDMLVVTGHMAYPPNADAAIHLAADVMPRVWKRRPHARAFLIGPQPPPELTRLHDGERVFVTGFVDDVRPYLARATVVTAPVRFGAGMKNKLQAGLAMEKAMVATSVACEGFDGIEDGTHVLVADGAERFADAVVALLEDPARRAELGRRGAEVIRRDYGWDAAVDVLWRTLRAAAPVATTDASTR